MDGDPEGFAFDMGVQVVDGSWLVLDKLARELEKGTGASQTVRRHLPVTVPRLSQPIRDMWGTTKAGTRELGGNLGEAFCDGWIGVMGDTAFVLILVLLLVFLLRTPATGPPFDVG